MQETSESVLCFPATWPLFLSEKTIHENPKGKSEPRRTRISVQCTSLGHFIYEIRVMK